MKAHELSANLDTLGRDEQSHVVGGLNYGELPTLQFNVQETMLASFYEKKSAPTTVRVTTWTP